MATSLVRNSGLCFLRPSDFVIWDDGSSTMQFCQFTPNLPFPLTYFRRHVDLNNDVQITALPGNARQPALAQTKSLATLSARRNLQAYVALESWHNQLAAQHGAPGLNLYLMNQVTAFD